MHLECSQSRNEFHRLRFLGLRVRLTKCAGNCSSTALSSILFPHACEVRPMSTTLTIRDESAAGEELRDFDLEVQLIDQSHLVTIHTVCRTWALNEGNDHLGPRRRYRRQRPALAGARCHDGRGGGSFAGPGEYACTKSVIGLADRFWLDHDRQ